LATIVPRTQATAQGNAHQEAFIAALKVDS